MSEKSLSFVTEQNINMLLEFDKNTGNVSNESDKFLTTSKKDFVQYTSLDSYNYKLSGIASSRPRISVTSPLISNGCPFVNRPRARQT
jgi:hypothetical protein